VLPSQYPEVQSYGHLQQLLANHIDMQFEDVRLLLRLPRKGSSVGANFATAAVLFNIISGASVAFHNTSWKALKGKAGGSGERFRGVLSNHFPFAEITIPKKTTIDVFYKYSRNPLAALIRTRRPEGDGSACRQERANAEAHHRARGQPDAANLVTSSADRDWHTARPELSPQHLRRSP
jgi:hypothetical protein